MTALGSSRALRIGVIAVVVLGLLGWLGSSRALKGRGGGYGFGSLAVGEPVYVSVAIAQDDAAIRWAEIEAVGPVEVRLVLCPAADQGAARECPGGPLEAVGPQLAQHREWDDPIGPSAAFVEVRRLEPALAAVCSVRVLHTSGMRFGLQHLPAPIGLPALDDQGEESAWEDPTRTLCG